MDRFLNHSSAFWTTVIGAALVRILTSDYHGPWHVRVFRGLATAFSAVFAAVIFTHSVLDFFQLPRETYEIPIAALLALTGEGLMRMLIGATSNLDQLLKLLSAWRGK